MSRRTLRPPKMALVSTSEESKTKTNSAVAAPSRKESVKLSSCLLLGSFNRCEEEDHTKKKNCKNNPLCLYGLQNSGGIWNASFSCESLLGEDPSSYLRCFGASTTESTTLGSMKCGLKNLGMTCYLNVFIQMLFNNRLVRDAINNIVAHPTNNSSSSSNGSEIVGALQIAFGHMESCDKAVYDLESFVRLLKIPVNEQQDPQELSKKFLEILENFKLPLQNQALPTIGRLISGKEKYSTTCSRCGKVSSSVNDFQEIGLNIEGCSDLESALANYLKEEELKDANQYYCSNCQCKTDAVRKVEIETLPTLLYIKLMRYVFDRELMSKKKLKSDVVFPPKLMIKDQEYVLVAVLYHKGLSANGGHYVTEVLDMDDLDRKTWWLCDDQKVVSTINPAIQPLEATATMPTPSSGAQKGRKRQKTADMPSTGDDTVVIIDVIDDPVSQNVSMSVVINADATSSSSSSSSSSSGDVDGKPRRSSRAADINQDTDDGVPSDNGLQPSCKSRRATGMKTSSAKRKKAATVVNGQAPGLVRTRDAYMLSYVNASEMVESLQRKRADLPQFVQDAVRESSASFRGEVEVFEVERHRCQKEVKDRQAAVEDFVQSIRCADSAEWDNAHFLPAVWLQQWATGERLNVTKTSQFTQSQKSTGEVLDLTDEPKEQPVDVDSTSKMDEDMTMAAEALADTSVIGDESIGNSKAESASDKSNCYPSSYLFADSVDSSMSSLLCQHYQSTASSASTASSGGSHTHPSEGGIAPDKYSLVKIVPNSAYRIVMNSIEQQLQMQETKTSAIPDFTLDNFQCRLCTEALNDRRSATTSKLGTLEDLLKQIEEDTGTTVDLTQSTEVYRISKTFVTALRNQIKSLTNLVKRDDSMVSSSSSSSSSATRNGHHDGEQKVVKGGLDLTVNGSVICPHHRLGLQPTKRTHKINLKLWSAIRSVFPDAIQLNDMDVPEIDGCSRNDNGGDCGCARSEKEDCKDCWYCCACEREQTQQKTDASIQTTLRDAELRDGDLLELYQRVRNRNKNTRAAIRLTAKSKQPRSCDDANSSAAGSGNDPSGRVALIDGKFLDEWLDRMAGTKNDKPRPLNNQELKCPHDLLLLPPYLRDITSLSCVDDLQSPTEFTELIPSSFPDVELVTYEQWKALAVRYSQKDSNGDISSEEVFEVVSKGCVGAMEWTVSICKDCNSRCEEQDSSSRTTFKNHPFDVAVIKQLTRCESDPTSTASVCSAAIAAPSRRSARSTRGANKKSKVILSSDDTVGLTLLKIFQEIDDPDVSPGQMTLYDGDRPLNAYVSLPLAGCGVLVGCQLRVVINPNISSSCDSNVDDALAQWCPDLDRGSQPVKEIGFQDSILGNTFSKATANVSASRAPDEQNVVMVSEEQVDKVVEITGQERGIAEQTLRACKGDIALAIERLMTMMM